jgi:hypothetical protein
MKALLRHGHRRNHGIVMLTALIMGLSLTISSTSALAGDQVRVTTSFDARFSSAVLHQVARLFTGGFGRSEADRVSQEIDGLKADQPRVWQFQVQYQGRAEALEVRALMDDLGMIDLDFTASPDAAPAVRAAVDTYLNGRKR